MDLLLLKLLFINVYVVTSFEHRFLTNWERLTNKVKELGGDSAEVNAEEKWIYQPVDHFDPNVNRTWPMKYFEDLSLWQSGGPIFLMIGGEGPGTPYRFGLIYELATETNAAVFFSEHRYYGKIMPDPTNLKYLSSIQAIYDLVNLLKFIKSDPRFYSSRVVAFGGSYSGNLAAWIRLLFPEVVDAAVSSSAPVLAKQDFFEYLEVVGEVLYKYGSPQCYETLSTRFASYKELFKTAAGIDQIKQMFNLCPQVDFTKKENIMFFFLRMTGFIMGLVQQSQERVAIQNFCNSLSMAEIHSNQCINVDFNYYIKYLSVTHSYMWIYQTCTEFGYFQTGNSGKQPFGNVISVDMYLAICKGLFGPQFSEQTVDMAIAHTNKMYGGLSPNLSKVMFVNGNRDPWAALGIKQSLSAAAPAVVIDDASHCSDYYVQPHNADARMKWDLIKSIVKPWISQ
ncbi:putative serine protease K12H4.7 [Plodia interpunctella]|uniref:putative serine protease K12H4.7 n=1 Tax=Plodia interpunctella TaxID=58824 RepID=UPI0023676BE2|nr:putative serine protease K12H4.7 [Plodia interpunctella]